MFCPRFVSLSVLLCFASRLLAQTTTSTSAAYSESGVPTGTPVAGSYDGALRPQIHFSPPKDFMNDPNGMFLDANGTYHLYYQYNPTDIVAGNQHWGHATSKDLYHWTNQPIAIYPGAPGEGIFSGSAVIDVNNTSGFFPGQDNGVVAMYTLNTDTSQTQQIAYSKDGGYTFTKYAQNPVIPSNSTQFRDPKVLWYAPAKSWVAVISYAQEFTIGIFTSPDLKSWKHASNFTRYGFLGLQYECPNLIALPMISNASIPEPYAASNIAQTSEQMYILQISVNPGAPQGGSISQYFPGTFNGTHFTPVDDATRLTDFGKDNYAGQFFYNIPASEPQISVVWASNWEYAQNVPTGPLENYRSSMGLPRVNVLANTTRASYTLLSYPYDLNPLHTQSYSTANTTTLVNSSLYHDYTSLPSGALAFSINITAIPLANATGTANFTFLSSATGQYIRGGFFLGGDTPFWLNRGHTGSFTDYNPFFTDKFSANSLIDPATQTFRLFGVIDRSILEVFLDNGALSATSTFFPDGGGVLDTLVLATGDLSEGVGVSAEVWELESAWATGGGGVGMGGNMTAMEKRQRVRRDGGIMRLSV